MSIPHFCGHHQNTTDITDASSVRNGIGCGLFHFHVGITMTSFCVNISNVTAHCSLLALTVDSVISHNISTGTSAFFGIFK